MEARQGLAAGSAVRQRIGLVTLLVRDYNEAIAYFTQKLGFALVQDTAVGAGKRWVVVAPQGTGGSRLLLAKPPTSARGGSSERRPAAGFSCSSAPTTFGGTMRRSWSGA